MSCGFVDCMGGVCPIMPRLWWVVWVWRIESGECDEVFVELRLEGCIGEVVYYLFPFCFRMRVIVLSWLYYRALCAVWFGSTQQPKKESFYEERKNHFMRRKR